MTIEEFAVICGRYNLEPNMALENDTIVDLLRAIKNTNNDSAKSGYRTCLIRILETEF
jgi:hypothetical protein